MEECKAVKHKQAGLVPIAATSPQARHYFTLADQVDRLVWASEADPDLAALSGLHA